MAQIKKNLLSLGTTRFLSEKEELSPSRLTSLEIARFIAAFCVASHHICQYAGALGTAGWHGVDLPPISSVVFFFVLSGFVIYTSHAKDFGRLHRIPRYFWRRACRIYPLYWLSLAGPLYFLWVLCSGHYLWQIFTLTPFVHNIRDINAVAWTLRFEIAFYLVFGLALLPYIGRVILLGWIVLDVWCWFPFLFSFGALREQSFVPEIFQRHFLNTQEMLFFAGLGAGALFLHWRPRSAALWLLLAVSGVAIVLLVRLDHWGFNYPPPNRIPLVGISFAAAIFSLAALERSGQFRLASRWSILGAISYPLYLFHVVIMFFWSVAIGAYPAMKTALSPADVFVLILAASLLLALAAVYLYDRPLQKALRGLRLFAGQAA